MAVKTSRAGSIKALRASTERKGGGNDAFLQRVPADDSTTVRFLTEPEDWQAYFEHYDNVTRYYPCSDDCPGCLQGDKPTQRYLANVLDIENDRVVPMVIPKSLVTKLLNSYDRYTTIMDRDYELIRLGSGLDTDYDRSPEAPGKRNVSKYTHLDLATVLENQLQRAFGATVTDSASTLDDDDEEETPPARAASRPGKKTRAVVKKAPEPEPEEEDDDDDEDDTPNSSRAELEEMSLKELRAYAKSDMGIDAADIRGLDQDSLVDLIVERQAKNTPTTVEDSDDDADDEDVDSEDEAAEEEDGEGDDEEVLTEADIRAMTLQELRKLCGELEIAWKRTDGKALLVKKILESTASEDDEDEAPF